MDKNLRFVLLFSMVYGLLSLGILSMHPAAASLRVADGLGNFEADAPGFLHVAMLHAE
jgi:hypothetical protein